MRAALIAACCAIVVCAVAVATSAEAAPRLDVRFGERGIARVALGLSSHQYLGGLPQPVVQRDGKVLVAVPVNADRGYPAEVALVRFRRDGSVDRSFGQRGRVRIRFRWHFGLSSLTVLEDDHLLLAGWVSPVDPLGIRPSQLGLVRLLPNGARDEGFGSKGFVAWNPPLHERDVWIDVTPAFVDPRPDGRLLVSTTVREALLPAIHPWDRFAFVRFLRDGSVDESFGRAGVIEREWDGVSLINWVRLPDGRSAALAVRPEGGEPIVESQGWFLHTFAPDGVGGFIPASSTKLGVDLFDDLGELLPRADGSLLAFGTVDGVSAARRLLRDGSLDPSYGTGCDAPLLASGRDVVSTRDGGALVAASRPVGRRWRIDSWLFQLDATGCASGRMLRLRGLGAGELMLRPRGRVLVAATDDSAVALVRIRR